MLSKTIFYYNPNPSTLKTLKTGYSGNFVLWSLGSPACHTLPTNNNPQL